MWLTTLVPLLLGAAAAVPPAATPTPPMIRPQAAPATQPAPPPPAVLPAPVITRQTAFSIPFELHNVSDPSQEPSAVQLYLSTDRGASWRMYSKVPPRQGTFPFRATADGEYWFAVRTVDRAGQLRPPWSNQPELRVVIDTVAPVVEIKATRAAGGQVTAHWEIREPLLNPDSLTVQYRGDSSQSWQLISLGPQNSQRTDSGWTGAVTWMPQGVGQTVQVRAEVSDLAGNLGVGHGQLDAAIAAAPPPASAGAPAPAYGPAPAPGQPPVMRVAKLPAMETAPLPPVMMAQPPATPQPPIMVVPPQPPVAAQQPQPPVIAVPPPTVPVAPPVPAAPPVAAQPPVDNTPGWPPPMRAAEARTAALPNSTTRPAPPAPTAQFAPVPPAVPAAPAGPAGITARPAADTDWHAPTMPAAGPPPPAAAASPAAQAALDTANGAAPGFAVAAPLVPQTPPPATRAQLSIQAPPPSRSTLPASPPPSSGPQAPPPMAPGNPAFDPRFPVNPVRAGDAPGQTTAARPVGLGGNTLPAVGPGTSVAMQFNPPLHSQYSPYPTGGSAAAAAAGRGPASPPLNTVRSHSFALDYDPPPGSAPVNRVEVWGTRDGGKTWSCMGSSEAHRTSTLLKVDDDGIYGFRVVPRSESGRGDALPRSGDAPQIWVSVDTAPANPAAPAAMRIREVRPVGANGL